MRGERFCEGVVLLRPANAAGTLAIETVCSGSEVSAFDSAGLRRMALRASGWWTSMTAGARRRALASGFGVPSMMGRADMNWCVDHGRQLWYHVPDRDR